ncbi:MAG: capsular polysaccharide biosynthesis protein [Nitrospirales bacterium]|nr:MAG: capsular polysaccharide biosynthesis protein [Nitrospirales bacterium]
MQELQNEKLRAMLTHAYQNVPYYTRTFDAHGIKPADVVTIDDLAKIPTLTKDAIRANPGDFIARNLPRRLLASGWTTGTTGSPLNVSRTLESIIFDKATLCRQRSWAGVGPYDRNVAVWGTVWGNVIVPRSVTSPPFWSFNAADNQLLLSYYHLSESTLPTFVAKLKTFKPAFIEGFPSTMWAFAKFLNRRGDVVPVQAIFTSSEPLYAVQRREIEQAFHTKVYDYYGHAERAVTAAECGFGSLHVNAEYGIVEILQGEDQSTSGERGEIVATGLSNFGMPLIRYRTGDMSRFIEGPCDCGRETSLLGRIDGRTADFIRTPDGRLMPGDGVMEAFYGIENIKESQIIQEAIDLIVVKVVKENPVAQVDEHLIRSNMKGCLGKNVRIDFEYVDSLWDTTTMKKRWVVSKVDSVSES